MTAPETAPMAGRTGVDALRALRIFHHLPEARLAALAGALAVRTVPAGTLVFDEGTPGDALFMLSEGEVRIDKRMESGMAELARLHPGDVFGELALIDNVPHSARAVAHTDAVLLVLGRDDLIRWLRSDTETAASFFIEVLRLLSHRLRRSTNEIVMLFDLGQLAVQRYTDEAEFARAALDRLPPRLAGEWSAAAYLRREFEDEVVRVGAVGPRPDALPESIALYETEHCWLDAETFCVALHGTRPASLGFLVVRSESALSPTEKGEVEVALTAAGQLIASALLNIRHDAEERLRDRLRRQAEDHTL